MRDRRMRDSRREIARRLDSLRYVATVYGTSEPSTVRHFGLFTKLRDDRIYI